MFVAMGSVDENNSGNETAEGDLYPQRQTGGGRAAYSESDHRLAPRESYIENLSFSSNKRTFYGRSRNIASTGLFVETPAELKVGDKIEVIFTVEAASRPLQLNAMVTRKTEEGVVPILRCLLRHR